MKAIRVMLGFMRQGIHVMTAYRLAFWMRLVNVFIKVFAFFALWSVLYNQSAISFPVDRTQVVTYGVVSVILSEILQWWDGPHFYIEAQIRRGSIISDLIRPVYFPFQLFSRWLGQSVAILFTVVLPVAILAFLLLPVAGPASVKTGILFMISLSFSYLILFSLNFLVGLIAFKTFSLAGINHVYHGLIMLLSGMWIPLWLYPRWLRSIAMVLPFQGIFFTPLSIYIGQSHGSNLQIALLHQAGWVMILILAVTIAWRTVYRYLTVQGG